MMGINHSYSDCFSLLPGIRGFIIQFVIMINEKVVIANEEVLYHFGLNLSFLNTELFLSIKPYRGKDVLIT